MQYLNAIRSLQLRDTHSLAACKAGKHAFAVAQTLLRSVYELDMLQSMAEHLLAVVPSMPVRSSNAAHRETRLRCGHTGGVPHSKRKGGKRHAESAPGPAGVDIGTDAQVPPHGQRVRHVRVQLAPQLAPREAARPDVTLCGSSSRMSLRAGLTAPIIADCNAGSHPLCQAALGSGSGPPAQM